MVDDATVLLIIHVQITAANALNKQFPTADKERYFSLKRMGVIKNPSL
jgi:hypothetical protein